jgi:predicted amidohydrolase YtcJ
MTGIAESILALDATAQVSVNGEDITWHDGNPNGITVEQITAKQAVLVAQAVTDAAAEVENKASAKSKLAALGLSEDELSAAFGI